MPSRRLTEDQIKTVELERIAWVLRVEPGSLSYVPGFGLSYDGAPEWLERELQAKHGWDATYATVVTSGGGFQSAPKETITVADQTWELVGTYTHGAEIECPVPENFPGKVTRERAVLVVDDRRHGWYRKPTTPKARRAECPMCEARIGSPHDFIYIGEGYEAVYKLVETPEETED